MSEDAAFELVGAGSDLLIRVRGVDELACLGAAVEAFAASLACVPPGVVVRRVAIGVAAADPEDLLIGVLDEAIVLLDTQRLLAVRLIDARIADGLLRGAFEAVELDAVDVHGAPPKAATWHGLRLAPADGHWEGAVMLDL